MDMDTITIKQLCKIIREALNLSKFGIQNIAEKLTANNIDCSAEKESLTSRIKNLTELLYQLRESIRAKKMITTTYTTFKGKKIIPEPDILEQEVPRLGRIKIGDQIRAFFDDFKPTVSASAVCTVVGFRRTKKSRFGKKPKDELEAILLYEDGHNKGNAVAVGLSNKEFFHQCDLIE